jgi:hypothetical protein
MKIRNTFLLMAVSACSLLPQACKPTYPDVKIEVIACKDTVISRFSPVAQGIKYGFEGGRVVKIGNTYHLITSEMVGDPHWVNMRLGHWTSADGVDWTRIGTLKESDGDFSGASQRAAVWGPMTVFDEADNHWHLVYTCYKGEPDDMNYDGVIQYAISTVPGIDGIGGPYEDKNILLRYDENPDPWEGRQGVDSFFPYKIGKKWYGFYGSATTQYTREGKTVWSVGLAQADRISGPWTRMSELNPVNKHGRMNENPVENPIVLQLDNGVYIAIVDGLFVNKQGYLLSYDGVHWSEVRYIDMAPTVEPWWELLRTPLSLIKEADGTYTMFFTAMKRYNDHEFGCLSKATVKIEW